METGGSNTILAMLSLRDWHNYRLCQRYMIIKKRYIPKCHKRCIFIGTSVDIIRRSRIYIGIEQFDMHVGDDTDTIVATI